MSNLVIKNLRSSFKLASKESIRWFPGHMGKGLKQMQQKLKTVDCIIEVEKCDEISVFIFQLNHMLTGS